MGEYKATVGENFSEMLKEYESGTEYKVTMSAGFVQIYENGEKVADLRIDKISDDDDVLRNW